MQRKEFNLTEGNAPYQVEVSAVTAGEDLIVIVQGGEKPHVGAVAISIPRPSLNDSREISSTTSVYALVGHKEDALAKIMAGKLASVLNRKVILTVGIHVDNITLDGIKEVENNCRKILEQLISHYLAT